MLRYLAETFFLMFLQLITSECVSSTFEPQLTLVGMSEINSALHATYIESVKVNLFRGHHSHQISSAFIFSSGAIFKRTVPKSH